MAALLQALDVTTLLTLVVALLPNFRRDCQPFARRFRWFLVLYVLPAYCLMQGIRILIIVFCHREP